MSDEPQHLADLIWSVSDLLRGDYKTSQYGQVILPFTVLRRLECVLAPTKQEVLNALGGPHAASPDGDILRQAAGHAFYNTSQLTLKQIAAQSADLAKNLRTYVDSFSQNAREVMERYEFVTQIRCLEQASLLREVIGKFADLDLRPETVSNHQMSLVFEELVRRIAEQSNETAGEHFTPRDVVRLMVDVLVAGDSKVLSLPGGAVRTVLDPVCGTGGMLSEAEERITELNPEAQVSVHGQDLNSESWAICRSDIMMRDKSPDNIKFGNIFTHDGHPDARFDYLLANPPFGVEWKRVKSVVEEEHNTLGYNGRFGAGLPRINDGSLLFLQHMLSKMKPVDSSGLGGSRVAIIFNGSPMHTGIAGSGESSIRRWIIENDWLEAVVALPDQLFYNTGIAAYFWILTNRKPVDRKGKVVLVDAREHWQKMRKPLGSKRRYIAPDQINEITQLYSEALSVASDANHPLYSKVRVLHNEDLGYRQITVNHPLKLRFEVTEEILAGFSASKFVQKMADPTRFTAALRPLIGSAWTDKAKTFAALKGAVTASGQAWPSGTPFQKVARDAFGVRDPKGEVQKYKGAPEPDSLLRSSIHLPLSQDPEEYFRRSVLPSAPEAWTDHTKERIGYEIPLSLFSVAQLKSRFEPLRHVAHMEAARLIPASNGAATEANGTDGPAYLRAQDLHVAKSAMELLQSAPTGHALATCTGGDLVGRPGNWRLLPENFGEAVTSLYVLHPQGNRGRTLCEWLNSRNENEQFPTGRDLMNLQVPVDVVRDDEFEDLLDDVDAGRQVLKEATSGILPNVFSHTSTDVQDLRKDTRSAASEARLIGELVRPLEDPVWRAEWSYPYHIAALARRYRISSHPAERKDGLLKLTEGIARTLGILALSDMVVRGRFTRKLRQQFRNGASFGTWLWLINKLGEEVSDPAIPELNGLGNHSDLYSLLEGIKDFRNGSHHAHGVRASHELDNEADLLEPRVVSALNSVNWLSGMHWDWVERCEYLDESSYKLVGQRLRGSHPSWEPFTRSSTFPLKPDHIFVGSTPSGPPVDLWPLASVNLCTTCNTRELFLIDEVRDGVLTLRSLEEHSLEIPYTGPE